MGLSLFLAPASGPAQSRRAPIIDVHLHAERPEDYGPPGVPNPKTGKPSRATTEDQIREACLSELRRLNVVRAVVSGAPERVWKWHAADSQRIIPAVSFSSTEELRMDLATLRQHFQAGRLRVLGEIGAQYEGLTLASPEFEPLLALAEELDIPVAIHTGLGPPNVTYEGAPKYRGALGNPLLIEEALVRHPQMRVYLMHAGGPFVEATIALMHAHTRVYADLAVLNWALPRGEFHAQLRRLMQHSECDIPKRLMFGSDQMIWPEAISMAVEGIESAAFLTTEQKRDILCRNAARFFKLDAAICQ
jgi:predicted TIM-barrel fold metal-dependent hydrolase